MSHNVSTYCLDANVLIKGWLEYYAPDFCAEYWEALKELGRQGIIFIPGHVEEEIQKQEDDLNKWLSESGIQVRKAGAAEMTSLQLIFSKDATHQLLVDNTRNRSLADPWVIAHAMVANCTVVTSEQKITASKQKVKIPNVCENMGIRCINHFDFIREVGFKFECKLR